MSICVQASTVDSSSVAHRFDVHTEQLPSDCKCSFFYLSWLGSQLRYSYTLYKNRLSVGLSVCL